MDKQNQNTDTLPFIISSSHDDWAYYDHFKDDWKIQQYLDSITFTREILTEKIIRLPF